MRVRFLKDYDYTPLDDFRITVAYKASNEPLTVKREAGEAAIKAGRAEEVVDPVSPLDHDADGRKGGSKAPAKD